MIVCDNVKCDFKIKNPTGDPNEDSSMYLNMPCPKCGENLLTDEDYLLSLKVMKIVNWLNKWFSWLLVFSWGKAKKETVQLHCHKGIKVKGVPDQTA